MGRRKQHSPLQQREAQWQQQLTCLQQQLIKQEQEIAALRAMLCVKAQDAGAAEKTQSTVTGEERSGRRELLKLGGAIAAAGAAALLAGEQRPVAHAADSDAAILGQDNYAGRPTYLRPMFKDRPPDNLLVLKDAPIPLVSTGREIGVDAAGASIGVQGLGGTVGVYGSSPNGDGTALKGEVEENGYGLFAHAGKEGVGVYGEAEQQGIAVQGVIKQGVGTAIRGDIPGGGVALAGYAGNGVGVGAEVSGDGTAARLAVNSNTAIHLLLVPANSDHPKNAPAGTLYVDKQYHLWYCNGEHWYQLA